MKIVLEVCFLHKATLGYEIAFIVILVFAVLLAGRIVTACSRRRLKNIFLYKTTFFLDTVDFHIGFHSMCKNGTHASLHIMFEVVVNSSIFDAKYLFLI